jgi:hypothetical protein
MKPRSTSVRTSSTRTERHIPKPVDPAHLLAAISTLIR